MCPLISEHYGCEKIKIKNIFREERLINLSKLVIGWKGI